VHFDPKGMWYEIENGKSWSEILGHKDFIHIVEHVVSPSNFQQSWF
jgi:hypothetical protein